jgi:hypothetical protein
MFFANIKKDLQGQIDDMKRWQQDLLLEMERMKTHIISLRGLVNRKLHNEIDETGDTKDLNNTVLLPDNGAVGKHR